MDCKIDKKVTRLMNGITNRLIKILGDNMVGIYIHGSVAFGCFNRETSDVDFLVVTEKEPDLRQKKAIITYLLSLDENLPAKGIETSFVLAEHCRNFLYPTPYCLHWSESHRDRYTADTDGHIAALQGTDKDLAAHFTVVNRVGITFYGKDKKEVFSPVPEKFYLDSIIYDIENAVTEISENPVYLTLNLCRVLAYIRDGVVLSKAGGGLWGMENLPAYKKVIKTAYSAYTENAPADFARMPLVEFAEFMIKEIYK